MRKLSKIATGQRGMVPTDIRYYGAMSELGPFASF
jgi:hypothetical protein